MDDHNFCMEWHIVDCNDSIYGPFHIFAEIESKIHTEFICKINII